MGWGVMRFLVIHLVTVKNIQLKVAFYKITFDQVKNKKCHIILPTSWHGAKRDTFDQIH